MADTIFALSTPPGRSAIGVIRISGPRALDIIQAFCGTVPPPRHAAFLVIRAPTDGRKIDEGLVLGFEEGKSYTGEAMAEFQIHGGVGVIDDLIGELSKSGLCRPAEPGEFTRRALENDRLDLLQAEGIADLIDATTRAQLRLANELVSGVLSKRVTSWREDLVYAAALLEATLDFADEEVPDDASVEVQTRLQGVLASLEAELAGFGARARLREGFEVAIVGPPNAGKSTLLNALAGREAAITSEIAGTTRDIIEVQLDLDGMPVTFLDTAGLRETEDQVEQIGIANTRRRVEAADLRIFLGSGDDNDVSVEADVEDLTVHGKADLGARVGPLNVSGVTGEGIAELLAAIGERLKGRLAFSAAISRERQRQAVSDARDQVVAALADIDGPTEILSERLRSASRALESLIGKVDVEDLLDQIFSKFCIGK